MNYSTKKVQASYSAELPRLNFSDHTNSPTFPRLLPDLSKFRHFQISRKVGNPDKRATMASCGTGDPYTVAGSYPAAEAGRRQKTYPAAAV